MLTSMSGLRSTVYVAPISALFICLLPAAIRAQGTNISESGLGTDVSLPRIENGQTVHDITGGTRRGTNLFHSFAAFSVGANHSANFLNDTSTLTSNILSRVTGGSPSNILGEITTTGFGAANLYLINPNGIVFGPNASIDVGGSFHTSTADFLRLQNNRKFNATPGSEDALLTSAPVTAFGFLDGDQAPIQVNESTLEVSPGKTLSLVGGPITIIGGRLNAQSGQINIASVASAGEVAIDPSTSVVSIDKDQFEALGTISFRAGPDIPGFFGPQPNPTNINVSSTTESSGSGSVFISGGQTTIDRSQVSAANNGGGDAGNIDLDVERLLLLNGAQINSSTRGSGGSGGNVTITATTAVALSGKGLLDIFAGDTATKIASSTSGNAGEAGNVRISTHTLEVSDGALIQATSTGDGRAGNIELNVGSLAVTDAQILGQASGKGNGGAVQVRASDESGAADLVSLNKGQITASTFGEGKGGIININAAKLSIDNGEVTAETSGIGTGGNVKINSAELLLTNGGTISAESNSTDTDAGASGNIDITASDTLRVFNNSSISVETQQATAGDINIKVGSLIHLKDEGKITTSASGGTGDGGNINIDPDFVILEGGSEITARAKEGSGGNINIVTGFLFQSLDSVIDASSETGIDGNINIDSPDTDIIPGTIQLPSNLLNAAALLSEPCFAKKLSNSSSLVVADQTGIPPGPDNMLSAQTEYRFDQDPQSQISTDRPPTVNSKASSEHRQIATLNSSPFANYIVSSKSPNTPCNSY